MQTAEDGGAFQRLPLSILTQIWRGALVDDPRLTQSALASFGSSIALAVWHALLNDGITIPDNDLLLAEAEESEAFGQPARTLISAVWRNSQAAAACRHLRVIPSRRRPWEKPLELDPTTPVDHLPFDGNADLSAVREIEPLSDVSFLVLLSRLPNLVSFSWNASRLPSPQLCLALGLSTTKAFSSFSLALTSSHATRWHAPNLASLPVSLTELNLSQLSLEGSRELASTLISDALPLIERLEISRTLFVDDTLLEAISIGSKKIRRLRIAEMAGTKLTEKGLAAVFAGCPTIQSLELDSVEGRLSKSCWTKLSPLPPNLDSISLVYAESGPHKSWTIDNLDSLDALLSSPHLCTLAISRRPPDQALQPGQHHLSRYPISDLVALRPLSSQSLDVILASASKWRDLDLDLFLLDITQLKRIMGKLVSLRRLKVLLDAPFKSLLTLTSSFALTPQLLDFVISIDPRHTPELAALSSPLLPTPSASPDSKFSPLTDAVPTHARYVPVSPPASIRSLASLSLPETMAGALPTTREWRRFLRKTHSLDTIRWTGRGGLGTWTFVRSTSASRDIRIDFEPVRGLTEDDVERSSRWASSSPVRWCSPDAEFRQRRSRRASSVSLAGSSLSSLSFESTSDAPPPTGDGLGFHPWPKVPAPPLTLAPERFYQKSRKEKSPPAVSSSPERKWRARDDSVRVLARPTAITSSSEPLPPIHSQSIAGAVLQEEEEFKKCRAPSAPMPKPSGSFPMKWASTSSGSKQRVPSLDTSIVDPGASLQSTKPRATAKQVMHQASGTPSASKTTGTRNEEKRSSTSEANTSRRKSGSGAGGGAEKSISGGGGRGRGRK